ncbi:hypothetical protein KQY27_04505 [Methanobrevibacter sp. TMH8]|uniref:pseudomurein-binding repeat-containing protein n=1 Tax=Methanobrevibacter sp. TMH8 TaxID=2848611 RepID=UPI001CD00332|nr:pseudomurein-binding repeat-containing protein [Methanobrevibacter sp. TMH8]MBZ9570808.1 hypothetical protein [Methanobrevibacter sp. TMH8]
MLSRNIKIILLFSAIIFLTSSFSFAENDIGSQNNSENDVILSSNNINQSDINLNNSKNSTEINKMNINSEKDSQNVIKAMTATVPTKPPKTISQSSILVAAKYVKTYAEKYGKLPNYVKISNYNYSMPEFMYLMSKTINNKYKGITSSITVKYTIKNPTSPVGNSIKKSITKKTYNSLATSISKYISTYNKAPNYVSTSFGKMKYQTIIYGFSKILTYSYSYKRLPSYLSLNIKSTNSINKYLPKYNSSSNPSNNTNNNTTNNSVVKPIKLSQSKILSASSLVKSYVESNGKLPNYVTISNYKFSIPEFLYLISKTITSKYTGITTDITVKYGIKNPNSPSGVSINKVFTKLQYNDISKRMSVFIENNNKAPNYISSKYGNIQYQTIVYGLSKIGDYINKNKVLPKSLGLNVPISHTLNKYLPIFTQTNNVSTLLLGSNELGTVELIGPFGNIKSNVKFAYIIGVTPIEASLKQLMIDELISLLPNQEYCSYIYRVNVTKSSNSPAEEELYGESLFNEFAQPHINNNNYNDVINLTGE